MFHRQWWRTNWWWFSLLLVGVGLRLWQFGHSPVSLYWDEMAMWNDARSVAETGRDLFDRSWLQPLFISYGDFKMPIMIWLVSLMSFWWRNPFVAVRLPSLLAGLVALPLVAQLVRLLVPESAKIKKPLVWQLGLVVAALLPWTVHFSRVGFEGHLGAVFLLASVVSLLTFHTTGRKWTLLPWVAFGILAVYSYFSVRYVWPVVSCASILLSRRERWRSTLLALVAGIIIWSAGLLPMIRGDFYKASTEFRLSAANILVDRERPHQLNALKLAAGNTLWSRLVYNEKLEIGRALFGQYLAYLDPGYLFFHGDPNVRHHEGSAGLMLPVMAPFFLLGLWWWWRHSRGTFLFLILWWGISVLPAAVPKDVPHALRSLNAFPVIIAFVVGGLIAALPWWKQRWLAMIMTGAFVANICWWSWTMFAVYPRQSAIEWQDGYWQLAQEVAHVRDRYVFVYVDNFDARFFLYYQPWSGLSWKEIQKLESHDFRRTIFKNVIVDTIDDWKTLERNSVVFTQRSRLPEGYQVDGTVAGSFGEELFVYTRTSHD